MLGPFGSNVSSSCRRHFSSPPGGEAASGTEAPKPEEADAKEGVQKEEGDEAAAAAAAAGQEEEAAEDPDKKKIAELEAQVSELKNQLLLSLADQENTRRIAQQDMENARKLAIKSFAKSLLEVWDNLSLALAAAKPAGGGEARDGGIYQGIEMTQKILRKQFEGNGLTPYGAEGDNFDPQVHNALSQYKDPSKEPGTVGQVVKEGFMLHKHVLRPADVMVVAKEE